MKDYRFHDPHLAEMARIAQKYGTRMAITDDKIIPSAGIAADYFDGVLSVATSQTAQPFLLQQMARGFSISSFACYTRLYTATITLDCGIVPVGGVLGAVTLAVGGTTTKYKVNSNFIGLSTVTDANTGLAKMISALVTDNNVFSTNFTINTAGTTGTFWGAVRIQMSGVTGTVVFSTKVVSADQTFATEALAKANCPAADAGKVNLGTITIQTTSGNTFTANTTALTVTGNVAACNYNGVASGFVSCMAGSTPATVTPVAVTLVQGVMAGFTTAGRTVGFPPGALLVGLYTTDGSGACTDAVYQIRTRGFPLNGEVVNNPLSG